MMAELRRLHSPDVECLKDFCPEQPEFFSILVQVLVGPFKEKGEETFDIEVCTPKWLQKELEEREVVIGRHLMIVKDYDYVQLVNAIKNLISGCQGSCWEEVAQQIGRLGKWEFDDYVE